MNYETDYLKLCKQVLDEGELTGDRTGTGTYSLFGGMIRHDMSNGFPLLTTKKINFGLVAGELLFFLNGVSDRRILQEKSYGVYSNDKHDIWKLDCTKASKTSPTQFNGCNLGEMYPEYFRMLWKPTMNEHHIIKKVMFDDAYKKPTFEDFDGDFVCNKINLAGLSFNVYNKRYDPSKNKSVCDVQFADSGYTSIGCMYNNDDVWSIKDRYHRSVFGVGYLGERIPDYEPRLYNMWRSMLERCYNTKAPSYANYGGVGVVVCNKWHNFSEFYYDVFCLNNFQKWHNNPSLWALDKDYLSGEIYSPATCVFLPKSINSKLTGHAVERDGKFFFSISSAEEYEGLSVRGSLDRIEKLGYKIINTDLGDRLIRPILFIDQLQNLIYGIKSKVPSRRLVLSNWNPDFDRTAVLAACHDSFQCLVRGNKLNLRFHCRSNDMFLGNPYNMASYGLLLHILAKLTGLEVGELVYFGTDVHLYTNHVDQITEQLGREPKPLPNIVMPEFETLDDLLKLTGKDFIMVDYEPHAFIKAPQAS